MTDIIARPVAEKLLNPATTPVRWEEVKKKFYDGGKGRPSSYGLEAFPVPVDESIFD